MPVKSHWSVHNACNRLPDHFYTTWWQAETQGQISVSMTVATSTFPIPGTHSESTPLVGSVGVGTEHGVYESTDEGDRQV